ncbi:MAG: type II toxin-antitoxin system Phd/YefM family antitoxin [Anaerolineae bacterium]
MDGAVVSVRELKARLSLYLREVRTGGTVTITHRGSPIGRIVPVEGALQTRMEALLESGLVAWSGHRLAPMAPVARERGGLTVADLLLEDRE